MICIMPQLSETTVHVNGTTPDPTPTPPETGASKIDVITVIDYTNHTHDISATCIQPYNDKLYMSYHTNEGNRKIQTRRLAVVLKYSKQTNRRRLPTLAVSCRIKIGISGFQPSDGRRQIIAPNLYVVGNYGYANKDHWQAE